MFHEGSIAKRYFEKANAKKGVKRKACRLPLSPNQFSSIFCYHVFMQRSAQPRQLSINLLPQDPFYETPIGRVMAWASTVGRYLVIFTEVVVIFSFASRFKLDRDLTDFNAAILQKSFIVDSYGPLENDVRLVQKKIDYLNQQKTTYSALDILDLISNNIPQNIAYTLVQVRSEEVQLTGTALTPEALALLVRLLQRQALTKALYVDQIKSLSNGASGFEFSMRLQLLPRIIQQTAPTLKAPVAPTPKTGGK